MKLGIANPPLSKDNPNDKMISVEGGSSGELNIKQFAKEFDYLISVISKKSYTQKVTFFLSTFGRN